MSKKEWAEKNAQERLEEKMENELSLKYSNCLLIFDCIPDFLEYLKMVKDKTYTVDWDTNYFKMIGFILQELDLVYISRTYLSALDKITEEGLKLLDPEEQNLEKYAPLTTTYYDPI